METSTFEPHFIEFLGEPWETEAPTDVRIRAEDAARSQENIRRWMAYLPGDCIRTMIAMRWDVTT
jgi:hypothetical protein